MEPLRDGAVRCHVAYEPKINAWKGREPAVCDQECEMLRMIGAFIMTRRLPFNLHLPSAKPTAIGGMSRAELDAELTKGVESLKSGKTYTTDEIDAELAKEFGI